VEGEDQLSGGRGLHVVPVGGFLGVGVGFAWTMAQLAASDRVRVGGRQSGVPGLSEFLKLGFVTGPAAISAHVGPVC